MPTSLEPPLSVTQMPETAQHNREIQQQLKEQPLVNEPRQAHIEGSDDAKTDEAKEPKRSLLKDFAKNAGKVGFQQSGNKFHHETLWTVFNPTTVEVDEKKNTIKCMRNPTPETLDAMMQTAKDQGWTAITILPETTPKVADEIRQHAKKYGIDVIDKVGPTADINRDDESAPKPKK